MPHSPAHIIWQKLPKDVETSRIAASAEVVFGLNLLRGIVDDTPGENVFISPLSVFVALQMAANGADGSTHSAIWKTLGLGSDTTGLNTSTDALQRILKNRGLKIANALWADAKFTGGQDPCDTFRECHRTSEAHPNERGLFLRPLEG